MLSQLKENVPVVSATGEGRHDEMRRQFFKGGMQLALNDRMVGNGIIIGFERGIIVATKCIQFFWNCGFDSIGIGGKRK
jgi:hypothetical protein